MSLNKVMLIGNVGADPQFKQFENGCTAQLSLATTKRGFKTKEGKEVEERTEWHNIVIYNTLAKTAREYVHKGDRLYIEGELRTRSYEDNQGVKRYVTEVVCQQMQFLSAKKEGAKAPIAEPLAEETDSAEYGEDSPF